MTKKDWGNVATGIIVHAQLVFNKVGIIAIDEVEEILGTAFSIINTYDLRERKYFENVLRWINSRLCLEGYPAEVITKYHF